MDKFSDFVLIIIIVVGLIGIPTFNEYSIIDNTTNNNVNNITSQFDKTVRNKGCVTQTDYNNFVSDLAKTGRVYDIEMTHTKILYYPLVSGSPGYTASKPYKEEDFEYAKNTIFASIFASTPTDYVMAVGDNFSVKVYNKGSFVSKIFGSFTGQSEQEELIATYGGAVTNET
jgi:hypothetical protein